MWGAVLCVVTVVCAVAIFPVPGNAGEMSAIPSESVGIGSILAAPDSYHLKSVTLQGKVKQVEILEPYSSGGFVCTGAYRFVLQDDTGSIGAIMPGACGKQKQAGPQVVDRDLVLVQARVLAPGHHAGETGLPIRAEDRDRLIVIVQWLSRSGN